MVGEASFRTSELPEICECRSWTRGHKRLSSIPPDHLPPVILLPETSVHLASLPPTPRVTFVYLIFRPIQQPLRQLLPPVLCERSGCCCLREIPSSLYRIFFSMEFANSWKRKKRIFPILPSSLGELMQNAMSNYA